MDSASPGQGSAGGKPCADPPRGCGLCVHIALFTDGVCLNRLLFMVHLLSQRSAFSCSVSVFIHIHVYVSASSTFGVSNSLIL